MVVSLTRRYPNAESLMVLSISRNLVLAPQPSGRKQREILQGQVAGEIRAGAKKPAEKLGVSSGADWDPSAGAAGHWGSEGSPCRFYTQMVLRR